MTAGDGDDSRAEPPPDCTERNLFGACPPEVEPLYRTWRQQDDA